MTDTTHDTTLESSDNEDHCSGLPWPKTWKGVYILVLASFMLWVLLLLLITEFNR